jgi:ATP phosphoribosyltransferase regulatory subunit
MSPPVAPSAQTLSARLAAFFVARGYRSVEPAMLLPAETVLDHMGEDIRRRLVITTAPDGSEFALRPDFTLPLALWQIENGPAAGGRYSYSGYAFRFPPPGDATRKSAEFRQVGIEDFGAADAVDADAGTVAAAVAALGECGLGVPALTIGDVSLFAALVDVLELGEVWSARLRRRFWRHRTTGDIAAVLAPDRAGAGGREAALGLALSHMDREDACAVIGEVMAIAGVGGAGGREAGEIAARFAQKAREAQGERPGAEVGALIERYLDIEVAAGGAVAAVSRFAAEAGLDLDEPIAALSARLDLVAKHGVSLADATFQTAAGRRIEYYTGFVFEARARGREDLGPVAGGGRYDRFLADLGAPRPMPAVGCSIYVDRVAAVTGAAA